MEFTLSKFELENYCQQNLSKYNIPGASLSIYYQGEFLHQLYLGVKSFAQTDPVNENTVFEAASLTNPLFSYLVMILVARGVLSLDTPLVNYTETPYINSPYISQITTRHILTHSSGFPKWARDQPLKVHFTPGSRWEYSAEGFLYLQHVIEYILQAPLEKLMDFYVFEPLGMSHSHMIWHEQLRNHIAKGHNRYKNPQSRKNPEKTSAAGTLYTNSMDYLKFVKHFVYSPEAKTHPLFQDTMTSQIELGNLISWGLGWGLQETNFGRSYWHWGMNLINASFVQGYLDHDFAICIFTNGELGLKFCRDVIKKIVYEEPRFFLHPWFDWPK